MKKTFLLFTLALLLLPITSQASPAETRLRGKILLQVEENGEAWYVKPEDGSRLYMKDGDAAYGMMRDLGLGISNADLVKIPIGFEDRFECLDSDSDGLCDKLEDGLGTDKNNPDSDGDGYNDGTEVKGDYNPLGSGKLNYDFNLINRLKGKILLQVESNGEAWYINPDDNKRYYMPDGPSAYQIMRFLSLGISNNDLARIDIGDALPGDSNNIVMDLAFLIFFDDTGRGIEVDISRNRIQYRSGDIEKYQQIPIPEDIFNELSKIIINNEPWSFNTKYGDASYFNGDKLALDGMSIEEVLDLGVYNLQIHFSQESKDFFKDISNDPEQQDLIKNNLIEIMCVGSCPSNILEIIEEIKLIVKDIL